VANISIQTHFQSRKKIAHASAVLLAAAALLVLPARSIVAQEGSPHVTAVDPAAGKPNDIVTVSGDGLEKPHVAAVFLSDDKDDHKVVVVSQAADKITIKIPELKPGDYNISIQSGNAILIEPVRFTVQ
jgi:IPT/TIG domain